MDNLARSWEPGQTVLVTGGAGFIGANFLNLAVPAMSEVRFVNVDKLTYAGNPHNVAALQDYANYAFERVDIADSEAVEAVFERHRPDVVVNFAAETHVDRSILDPLSFVRTNLVGTANLLEAARRQWSNFQGKVFHHVSTDEVFGSLGDIGLFSETTPYDPSSPYSASKAGSDHLVRAYYRTFGIPTRISNCSNNYGPYQFPEKLIPLVTMNALARKPIPVYGKGENIRDWLFVEDHCDAIWRIIEKGGDGETYNVGGKSERRNIDVVKAICSAVADETSRDVNEILDLIQFVGDRPGHDYRYGVDTSKIEGELGWRPLQSFESGLKKTVHWYLSNGEWLQQVQSGAYRDWIAANYEQR